MYLICTDFALVQAFILTLLKYNIIKLEKIIMIFPKLQ